MIENPRFVGKNSTVDRVRSGNKVSKAKIYINFWANLSKSKSKLKSSLVTS